MWKVLIGVIVFALIGVGGYLYYQSSQKKLATPPANTMVEITPTQEPPTPTVEAVEKDAFEIEIQNGSGVPGRAAAVKETLEEDGYIVSKTGNADDDTYAKTTIYASEDVGEAYIKELTELVSKTYVVNEKVEDIADVKTSSSVVIVVGKDEADNPTPTEAEN